MVAERPFRRQQPAVSCTAPTVTCSQRSVSKVGRRAAGAQIQAPTQLVETLQQHAMAHVPAWAATRPTTLEPNT